MLNFRPSSLSSRTMTWLRCIFLVLSVGLTQNVLAEEMPEGMVGWWYLIGANQFGYARDEVTACRLTAKNHYNKELLEMRPNDKQPLGKDCMYLHAMKAVNDLQGPQWYGSTYLQCKAGYFPKSPGVCVKGDHPLTPLSCKDGTPGQGISNPVTIASGAKVQTETDFAGTPAGALQISRTYRPFAHFYGGQSAGNNWTFSFDRVFHIKRWSEDGRPLTIEGTLGDGSYFSFAWNPTIGRYESKINKTATLAPTSANYEEWVMVINGRADRFKRHVISYGQIVSYLLMSSRSVDGAANYFVYHPGSLKLHKITDEHGRTLEVELTSHAITSITGPEGSVKYSYDWRGVTPENEIPYTRRLLAVTYFDAAGISIGRRQYHYENESNPYFFTGITDENGKRFSTYTYDSAARTLSSEHAEGANRFTFVYPDDRTRIITDPAGAQSTIGIRYVSGGGVTTGSTQPAGAGCAASASEITHDGVGAISSKTDFNGIKACFVNDKRGLETWRIEGLAAADICPVSEEEPLPETNIRQYRTKWHPDHLLQTAVAEPKRITTYLYNGQPDSTGTIVTCGANVALAPGKPLPRLCRKSVQPTTDSDGRAGFAGRPLGSPRVWNYSYRSDGKLLKQTGPADARGRAQSETRLYYNDTNATHTAGDLASVTNSVGEMTSYLEYSPSGLPTKVRLPNQLTATLRYGPRQHLLSVELNDNRGGIERTNYEYDGVGNLTRSISPDGAAITYSYDDAHRLTQLSDNAGNRIQLTLDAAGNAVVQEIYGKAGDLVFRLKRSYDVLNRLQQEQTALDAVGSRFEYDPNGNLTKVIDELGRATDVKYDAFNRVIRETRFSATGAVNQSVGFAYDHQDELLSVTDPRGLETKYTVDSFGAVTSLKSPDTGTTTIGVDRAGNVETIRDARGMVLPFEYDAAGRITRHGNSRFEYGAAGTSATGKLAKMTDDSGQTAFAYDGFGRLLTTSRTGTASLGSRRLGFAYTYGTAGTSTAHVQSITYPSGNRVDITYGSNGRPSTLSFDAPDKAGPVALIKDITYRPFGDVVSWSWGNSTTAKPNLYTRKFDADGRITAFPLGYPGKNGVARTLRYDAVDRIETARHTGTATAAALDQKYFYDDLDRLTGFDSASVVQSFSYDANGNRTSARFGATTYKYTTSPTSNRLNSTTGPAPAKVNAHDAAGNLTSDGNIKYSYGANGRLVSAIAGGITTTYHYNGFGQRVAKSAQGRVIAHYVYDDEGHLLGEYDNAGLPIQETIYLGDSPVAVIKPGTGTLPPAIHYVYADHLQTARVITRATDNTIVWRWYQSDPFGLHQPDENPNGVGSFTYNPRFPGQLYDKETNNHYNYFRDYDPQTGRYIQSDPIGLNGGVNTYSYVSGNPVGRTDALGLADINLFSPFQPRFHGPAEAWNPKGVFSVAGHGNFRNMNDAQNRIVWPHDLAKMIRAHPNFHGQRIVLGSCSTTRPTGVPGEPNFAQRLANYLGVPVTGPTDLTYPPRGDLKRIPSDGNGGLWITIYPQATYKGRRF